MRATRQVLDSLRASLTPGATLAYLAAPAPGVVPVRLWLVRSRVPGHTARWLARLRRLGGASPAFSKVGSFEQYEAGFAADQLLGPLAAARPAGEPAASFSTVMVGSYLVLSDTAGLRAYLAEVAAGQVWSRSATQVALLQQTLPLARLTLLADVRQGWNALLGNLAEERRAGLLRNESLLRYFSQVAWQLVPPEQPAEELRAAFEPGSQYFAQLVLRRPGQALTPDSAAAGSSARLRFRAVLAGQPVLLPAVPTADGSLASPIVVADSLGQLRLLPAGTTNRAWVDTLPGPVVGSGPRLLRGRLLLATAHRLHWLSPVDGREAAGFPFNLPDTAAIAAVAAGTSSRVLVATTANDLLLFDTNGRRYPGWPHRLEAPLAGPPVLLTVGGRDVVVAALRNGYVYAFDQAGGAFRAFPSAPGRGSKDHCSLRPVVPWPAASCGLSISTANCLPLPSAATSQSAGGWLPGAVRPASGWCRRPRAVPARLWWCARMAASSMYSAPPGWCRC
ncbi:hypothetical protein [Hymenobacter sp. BRD67]|uniref:hypothetical protein n=1 Tax=Hymenobacter sp. BRD67 TaxID=2675877 RepID=UPI0015642C48|nr:hypothetical protein [Hymenobacter sp. BRD67]QKG52613.1 hypothetical protein GKZ67_08380 [Hymenobacter sp. BRD67]